MYEAVVLICLMGNINSQCLEAVDKWGPYHTKAQCEDRLTEMVNSLIELEDNPFQPAGKTCNLVKGGSV